MTPAVVALHIRRTIRKAFTRLQVINLVIMSGIYELWFRCSDLNIYNVNVIVKCYRKISYVI